MSLKDAAREIRKAVKSAAAEFGELRREVQLLAHDLKITPIRNFLIDEIRIRRPIKRVLKALEGEG
ncbi:MAG: hypothetical protein QXP81_10230 [Nitrososphaerota archaeon]